MMGLTPSDPIWPIFWGFGGSRKTNKRLKFSTNFSYLGLSLWSLQTPKIWVRWGQMGSDPSGNTPGPTQYPYDPYLTPNRLSEPIIAEITVKFLAFFYVSFWSPKTPKIWVRWGQMGSDPSVHTPGPAPYPSDPFLSDFRLATGL